MVSARKLKSALKFDEPSNFWYSSWREALVTGNGKIGASVLGGVKDESIMITHQDLMWQGREEGLCDISDKIKSIRKMMFEGNYKEADSVMQKALINKNYRPQAAYPLPLCDFKVTMPITKSVKDYMRVVNMENGEVSVVYKDGATKYDRSLFVSRENDYIVYEINKSGNGLIDVSFSLDIHDRNCIRTKNAISKLPEGIMNKTERGYMYFSARNENGSEFGAVARIIQYNGSQTIDGDKIIINGASNVLVIMKTFVNSQREKEWRLIAEELKSIKSTYDKLLKGHTAIHGKLFTQMEVDFDAQDRDIFDNDLLKESRINELTPALMEKLWAYGRYLFVCSTSEGGKILNPYGLWCGDYKAELASTNIATDLAILYSHAYQGNLEELCVGIFNYYENILDDLKKNATRLYGVRGIFIPSINSRGMGFPANVDNANLHFTGCAGIISKMFYNYYLYTADKKFLKDRALPFMKEALLFYEDFLKLNESGYYESSPSYSPNNTPANYLGNDGKQTLDICENSTVDFAIVKQLLLDMIEGAKIANVYKDEIAKWQDMLTKIPNYEINKDGAISEYIGGVFEDNYNSEFAPHLYPVVFGGEINLMSDPELKKAFLLAAKKRITDGMDSQSAPSIINLAIAFASLGDSEGAMECLNYVVKGFMMNNLITMRNDFRGQGIGKNDFWATYSIVANMGFSATIQRMILTSCSNNTIAIFPALPDELTKGSVKGFLLKEGVTADIQWDTKKGNVSVSLKARKATDINILFKRAKKVVKFTEGVQQLETGGIYIEKIELKAGKAIQLDFKI